MTIIDYIQIFLMITFAIMDIIFLGLFYKSIKYRASILDFNFWTFLIKFKLNKQSIVFILFNTLGFIILIIILLYLNKLIYVY